MPGENSAKQKSIEGHHKYIFGITDDILFLGFYKIANDHDNIEMSYADIQK